MVSIITVQYAGFAVVSIGVQYAHTVQTDIHTSVMVPLTVTWTREEEEEEEEEEERVKSGTTSGEASRVDWAG